MKSTKISEHHWRTFRVEYECPTVRGRSISFATEEEAARFIACLAPEAKYRLSQIDQTIKRQSA